MFFRTILFKSIEASANDWAKDIISWQSQIGRPANIEKIKLAGFDSKTIVKQLTKIYLADV